MSTIIAIETSSEIASAALLHGGEIISCEAVGVQTHSQTILPMVQSLMAQAGLALTQCDAIAFGSGPGSFTGLRTACGIAQGLAYGLDKPVVPVVTLEAMAQACRGTGDISEASGTSDVLVVLDARMGEVYWAQYRFLDEWLVVTEPTLSAPSVVAPVGGVRVCGNGLLAYASEFSSRSFMQNALCDIQPHAVQIAQLADVAFKKGQWLAARDAQPLYLRNKIALTTSERLANLNAANTVGKVGT